MRQPNWFHSTCEVWFVRRDNRGRSVATFIARNSFVAPNPYARTAGLEGVSALRGHFVTCRLEDDGFTNAGTPISGHFGLRSGEIKLCAMVSLDLDNSFCFSAPCDDSQKRAYSHTTFASFDAESNPLPSASLSTD
jgi:hypothetical protein